MTNEEKYLNEHLGKRNPFKVPEGYFDSLVSEVMEKLPDAQQTEITEPLRTKAVEVTLFARIKPLLYVAACLLVAVFSFMVYFSDTDDAAGQYQMSASAGVSSDTYLDEMTDYAMVDNYDIYACLTNE
jgi:hypothetical protein